MISRPLFGPKMLISWGARSGLQGDVDDNASASVCESRWRLFATEASRSRRVMTAVANTHPDGHMGSPT
jgi:hypothetical protein